MNLFRLAVFPLVVMLAFSLPSSLNSSLQIQPSSAQTASNNIVPKQLKSASNISQPLLPVGNTITKSFSYPLVRFYGSDDDYMTETISWYQNGTVALSDSQGNNFSFDIPISGGTLTLLQNDTAVDQKFEGAGLNYDVFWKAIKDQDGYITKYKFTINGGSSNGYTMQLPMRSSETIVPQSNMFLAVSAKNLLNNDTSVFQGLGIDWSDAVSSGYKLSFDKSHNYINLNLGTSFSIDPQTVDTVSVAVSPQSSNYYEGERRVMSLGGNIWAFYYDGSNIAYKYSQDSGQTWSAKSTDSTGAIASDYFRWTIVSTSYAGTNYVTLFYYVVSGSNTQFYGQVGTVGSNSIVWSSPHPLFSESGTNLAAAATATTDTSGNVYAAFRYITGGDYHFQIWKWTPSTNSWTQSKADTDAGDALRIEMSLARLSSGNMLFVYAMYDHTYLTYYELTGGSWGSQSTVSISDWTSNSFKQISGDSDSTQIPYIAYLTGGNSGTVKVVKWTNSGGCCTFETVSSTSQSLPSITMTSFDNSIHVYGINSLSHIIETDKPKGSSSWYQPANSQFPIPGTADQLTAGFSYAAVLFEMTYNSSTFLQYAQGCSASGGGHCYAQYWNGVTSSPLGNRFTTTITGLQDSNTNAASDDFINIEHWLILQGGISSPTEWLENGFTVGPVNGIEYSTPTSFHAYDYPSGSTNYHEFADTSVRSGTHTYTIYGDGSGNWYWQIDGSQVGSLTNTSVFTADGLQAGAETTDQSPVIPTSSLNPVQVTTSAGNTGWQNWPSGVTQNDRDFPPIVMFNCGSTSYSFNVGYGVFPGC